MVSQTEGSQSAPVICRSKVVTELKHLSVFPTNNYGGGGYISTGPDCLGCNYGCPAFCRVGQERLSPSSPLHISRLARTRRPGERRPVCKQRRPAPLHNPPCRAPGGFHRDASPSRLLCQARDSSQAHAARGTPCPMEQLMAASAEARTRCSGSSLRHDQILTRRACALCGVSCRVGQGDIRIVSCSWAWIRLHASGHMAWLGNMGTCAVGIRGGVIPAMVYCRRR
jgi:hypothetical protein